jgi:hypothetical protein
VSGTARTVGAIDWKAWRPTERATLLFVIRDGEVLLIRKKTGLGAGRSTVRAAASKRARLTKPGLSGRPRRSSSSGRRACGRRTIELL